MKLKFAPFCSPRDALSYGILFCRNQNFQILAENHGLYIVHGLIFASPKKFSEKYAVLNRTKREI